MSIPEDDGAFQELADEIEPPALIILQQDPELDVPEYELLGDLDLDEAIAMTVKGLFVMLLDAIGFWPDDDEEEV